MTFKGNVQKANQVGSKKIIIPKDVRGPDGEEIEIGDDVILDVVGVEKQGDN